MSNEVKILKYNLPQFLFLVSKAKTVILEWGRGTGKSTILAKRILDCVIQLPRSTGMIYGESYMQIKARTLPSTIQGLEQHGYIKDLHYFVGRKPPKDWNWPEAYQPPLNEQNCIFWWNGTVTILVSQDGNASSGRGLNVDWIVGDEALLYNGEKYMTDASATNRGNLFNIANYPDGSWKYFKDCHLHHSTMLASSTPISVDGQWFLKYEEEARDPDKSILFLRASAMDNLENLGADFFENQKAIMPDFLYNAEVLNIRITQIKDGFYPKLDETKHGYATYNVDFYRKMNADTVITCESDSDLEPSLPLICAVDWGANINCMVISQKVGNELKFLKNLYVKTPKILDDLAMEQFIPYYEPHKGNNNRIHLFYDPSGNVSTANSRLTFAQQFAAILTAHGWQVDMMTRGMSNESHQDKYGLWNILFSEKDNRYPKVKFNRYNCKELLISMKNAPAKRGLKVAIQKVKTSEKRKSMAQEHATHFSDTADLIVTGLFMAIYKGQPTMPMHQIR